MRGGVLNMKTNGAHLSLISFMAEILLIKSIDMSQAMITFVTLNPHFHTTRLYGIFSPHLIQQPRRDILRIHFKLTEVF